MILFLFCFFGKLLFDFFNFFYFFLFFLFLSLYILSNLFFWMLIINLLFSLLNTIQLNSIDDLSFSRVMIGKAVAKNLTSDEKVSKYMTYSHSVFVHAMLSSSLFDYLIFIKKFNCLIIYFFINFFIYFIFVITLE